MKLTELQPAKTYDTNILSSAIGRCSVDNLSVKDQYDIIELSEASLKLLNLDKPLVPHTDPVLLRKFLTQLERLYGLSGGAMVRSVLGETLSGETRRGIRKLFDDAAQIKGDQKFLCTPREIEAMFGIENMWDSALKVADEELEDKSSQKTHPNIPAGLLLGATQCETRKLIEFVIREIFQMDAPHRLNDYVSDDIQGHHLFWTTRWNQINYLTPASYDLATQLSCDIPHNAGHIAHLSAHPLIGVHTYIDDMEQRAYFESVAVLSEHRLIKILEKDFSQVASLYSCIEKRRQIYPEEFMTWILADRIFEARLRVARLLADQFTIEGLAFDEVVKQVAKKTGLSAEAAESESSKYYTQTGLGAVYVLGPKRLMEQGLLNPKNAILGANGEVIKTWQEFKQQAA